MIGEYRKILAEQKVKIGFFIKYLITIFAILSTYLFRVYDEG